MMEGVVTEAEGAAGKAVAAAGMERHLTRKVVANGIRAT
jgi:hypothetical protein